MNNYIILNLYNAKYICVKMWSGDVPSFGGLRMQRCMTEITNFGWL